MIKNINSFIVYDSNKRLRLRLGAYRFNKEEGFYLENQLLLLSDVEDVRTNHYNGSITVRYVANKRAEILNTLVELLNQPLKTDKANGSRQNQLLKEEYKYKFVKMTVKRQLLKMIVPLPFARIVLIKKSLPFILNGLKALKSGKLNIDVLDATSIGISIWRGDYGTAGSVMYLLGVSELMKEYTENHTLNSLKDSLAVSIDHVWKVVDGQEEQIAYNELKIDDVIHIHQGSMVPVDGLITDGDAMINESAMTGEPISVHKHAGLMVYAGTIIEEGDLYIAVKSLAENSRISKIIELIDKSESLKASAQSRAEMLADKIVPFSYITFLATFILTRNIERAISILMVDYSCALKLSMPISIITAMRDAANHKMLIKGGKHFEKFSQADTIVFDKTGTLTKASPKVEKVLAFNDYTRREVLKISACLEEHFPHSLARAIVKQAADEDIYHAEEHGKVEYIVAHGIASILYGDRVLIGSAHFIYDDENVEKNSEIEAEIEREMLGLSVIRLAIGGKIVGAIGVADEIRDEAKTVIAKLKTMGFNVVMLTGDNPANANRIANILEIDQVYAGVLPDEKADIVTKLKENHKVIMIGDGINDSPALSVADISVAMSDAADIARETADINLVDNDLNGLITLKELSEQLFKRISYNYNYIVGVNSTIMALGALGMISPLKAALYHNSATVILSAKSMLAYKLDQK